MSFVAAARTLTDENLAEAANTIYTIVSNPRKTLRTAVVDIVHEKSPALLAGESSVFEKLFRSLPSFGGNIARGLIKNGLVKQTPSTHDSKQSKRYNCPSFNCRKHFKANIQAATHYSYTCCFCAFDDFGVVQVGHKEWNFRYDFVADFPGLEIDQSVRPNEASGRA